MVNGHQAAGDHCKNVNRADSHRWDAYRYKPKILAVRETVGEMLKLGVNIKCADKVRQISAGKTLLERCKSDTVRRLLALAELHLS